MNISGLYSRQTNTRLRSYECVAPCAILEHMRLSERTTSRLGYIGPTLPRHRTDGTAGTTRLNHHSNYCRTASIQVMTTGRTELLEDGHRRRYRRGRMTSSVGLLRAGWSSGQTRPEKSCTNGKRTARPCDLPGAGRRVTRYSESEPITCSAAEARAGSIIDEKLSTRRSQVFWE
jgi:hypothetical protein